MRKELEIKLTNQLSEIDRVNQTLTEFGKRYGLAPEIVHDFSLALEEIFTNIVSYGLRGRPRT